MSGDYRMSCTYLGPYSGPSKIELFVLRRSRTSAIISQMIIKTFTYLCDASHLSSNV